MISARIMIRYYFLIASQDFLLSQEPIEEILRERLRHYSALKKDIDFCFTTNLSFLSKSNLSSLSNELVKPSAAIISLNPQFINWLKLRVQYGICGTFLSNPIQFSHTIMVNKDFSIL